MKLHKRDGLKTCMNHLSLSKKELRRAHFLPVKEITEGEGKEKRMDTVFINLLPSGTDAQGQGIEHTGQS